MGIPINKSIKKMMISSRFASSPLPVANLIRLAISGESGEASAR
jgi:hypothetical protein